MNTSRYDVIMAHKVKHLQVMKKGSDQPFSYIIIIGFLIYVQVQGHHPHQWAPFQVTG